MSALRSDIREVQDPAADGRIPILYLAPWVDIGGSDTATIDWFRHLDRARLRPSLITTQVARAPVTGELGPIRAPVPWAARFGTATAD